MTDGETGPLLKIAHIHVDSMVCLAHDCCVRECPEVFNVASGAVALHPRAAQYYESKAKEIFAAERLCPVDAILVETDPPRSIAARTLPARTRQRPTDTRPLVERLREARALAEGKEFVPTKITAWQRLKAALVHELEKLFG